MLGQFCFSYISLSHKYVLIVLEFLGGNDGSFSFWLWWYYFWAALSSRITSKVDDLLLSFIYDCFDWITLIYEMLVTRILVCGVWVVPFFLLECLSMLSKLPCIFWMEGWLALWWCHISMEGKMVLYISAVRLCHQTRILK